MYEIENIDGDVIDYGQDGSENNRFSYQFFIDGLKKGKYKNVVIMTGEGASLSAGMPNFRSITLAEDLRL